MKNVKKTVDLSTMTREELEAYAMQKSMEAESLGAKLSWYEEQYQLSRAKLYGASSEKTPFDQMSFFNEAESESYGKIIKELGLDEVKPTKKPKQKGHKAKILKALPTEIIEYKLSSEEAVCPQCGGDLHEMSKEVRNELKVIPAKIIAVEHVRYTYACRNCDQNGTSVPVLTAKMPNPPIPNSLASASMLAHIINRKYVEALPLYRQEQQFRRYGLDLSRQTLSNWVIKANRLLQPLYDEMHKELLKKDVLHADETVLEVLSEPGREVKVQSYMWLYRTSGCDRPLVLYEYTQGRSGDFAKAFLKGFKGYLHVDGYAGYHKLKEPKEEYDPKATLVGCWAHARRKYDEALKAISTKEGIAAETTKRGLEYCNTLFKIEAEMKELSSDARKLRREKEAKLILTAYFEWAEKTAKIVLPKSKLGDAINYSLNQREYLENFLLDGRLEISNNRAERSIKPFVIGRKNWLFSNTPAGANASAVLYSIVETAKENELNPFPYLEYLFEQIPNIDASNTSELEKLLPYSKDIPERCTNLSKT